MATLGDLVVKIGANTFDFNKKLGHMQRTMRAMTGNIEAMGRSMTRSLTLPIVGVGAAAIKSAADLESLEVSFISLTGSAEGAAAMMKNLNEFAAKTPFQVESIANAARQLVASGTEISEVNNQLQFLGDIAATSGSSIEEIAAIFAKVNAKGKVELENLNQLAERGIPIFKMLSEATGLPADKLGAGRVTVQQFNETLKAMAQDGGFAAGAMERLSQTSAGQLSTAFDNAKQALASLGVILLPIVNNVLQKIIELSKRFQGLSPNVKEGITRIGVFIATLGPMLIVLPKIAAGIKAISFSLSGLTKAIAKNPIGLLAVGLSTLAASMIDLGVDTKAATVEVDKFAESLIMLDDIAKKGALEAEIKRLEERFGRISDNLTKAQEKFEKKGSYSDMIALSSLATGYANAESKLEEYKEQLEQVNDRLADNEKQQAAAAASADSHAEALRQFNLASHDYEMSLLRQGEITEKTSDKVRGKLLPSIEDLGLEIEDTFVDDFEIMPWEKEAFDKLVKLKDAAKSVREELENIVQGSAASMLMNLGEALGAALTAGQKGFSLMAASLRTLGGMLQDIGALLIETAASFIVFQKNIFKNPYLAAAAGVAFVAAGAALRAKAEQFEAPALAQGGLAYGPTMALVGDNRSASIDPEVIAPLSKLRDMMGGNTVEVVGRISGNDIFLSNARATTSRNRYA